MQNLVTALLLAALVTIQAPSHPAAGSAALLCRIAVDDQKTWCECRGTAPGHRVYRPYPLFICQLQSRTS